MKVWFSTSLLGFAIVFALTATGRTPLEAQVPVVTSGLDPLFARVYPVFAHDRCANCHGRVQHYPGFIRTVTAETHPGGDVIDPKDLLPDSNKRKWVKCGDCHDAPEVEEVWEFTAPDSMEWAAKTPQEVCAIEAAQVKNFNGQAGGAEATRDGSYLHHVSTDPLIDSAWRGRAGGARTEDSDLPAPPLSKRAFVAALTDWVNAGAPCRTTGVISQVERFSATYSTPFPVGIDGKVVISTGARRELMVLRNADGTANVDITGSGHDLKVTTYKQSVPQRGLCNVTMINKTDWVRIGPDRARADLKIRVQNGGYEINFMAPGDPTTSAPAANPPTTSSASNAPFQQWRDFAAALQKPADGDVTRLTSSARLESDCGLPNVNDVDDPVEATWPAWDFTIRCPNQIPSRRGSIRCDPAEPTKKGTLTGTMTRTVLAGEDAADPQSWLNISPIGTGRADSGPGAPTSIPVTVTTMWDFTLGQK
jgi:hypothetical protein